MYLCDSVTVFLLPCGGAKVGGFGKCIGAAGKTVWKIYAHFLCNERKGVKIANTAKPKLILYSFINTCTRHTARVSLSFPVE